MAKKGEQDSCPKCGAMMDIRNYDISVLINGIMAVAFLSVAAWGVVVSSGDKEVVFTVAGVCLIMGILMGYKAYYWFVRETFICKKCGYRRVSKRR